MNFAKTTSIATVAALLALGTPVLAQSSSPGGAGSSAGASGTSNTGGTNTSESHAADQQGTIKTTPGAPMMSSEGRNNTMNPGEAKATGSGNSDDGRRDCTDKQTPC